MRSYIEGKERDDGKRGREGGKLTLYVFGLSQQQTRLLAKDDGTVDGRNGGHARPEVPFRLVDVVGALSAASDVLRVDRVDPVSTRADAQDEGILHKQNTNGKKDRRLRQYRTRLEKGFGFGQERERRRTLDLTGSSYSVFRWTTKLRTDCLCSCSKRPKRKKGINGFCFE
jgi:hypothetical protein